MNHNSINLSCTPNSGNIGNNGNSKNNKIPYKSFISIPSTIRYDDHLTPGAKLLYGELLNLCSPNKSCWVKNSYLYDLSSLYGTHIKTIHLWIRQLSRYGYIYSTNKFKEKTHQITERYFKIN